PQKRGHSLNNHLMKQNQPIAQTKQSQTAQMKKLFDFGGNSEVKMVNNYDWTHEINIIEFLRDYGKNFSINSMLAK
ncbi:hypothetical protein MMJ09_28065, partial [Bacillus vallismortis]|nr:hypothetical protein [Bacillus vallismortis]